jgi:hypothetical protein
MASTTKNHPITLSKRVSFNDDEAPCTVREEVISSIDRYAISDTDKSKLWYSEQEFSLWRSDAASLVSNFLSGKNATTTDLLSGLKTSSPHPHHEPQTCLRGLENMLGADKDERAASALDAVLVAQRRQKRRGFRDDAEIAAAYSSIASRSQREAMERALKDYEEAKRHHDASEVCLTTNITLNKEWECARPKRHHNSRTRMLHLFRRNKRNP